MTWARLPPLSIKQMSPWLPWLPWMAGKPSQRRQGFRASPLTSKGVESTSETSFSIAQECQDRRGHPHAPPSSGPFSVPFT